MKLQYTSDHTIFKFNTTSSLILGTAGKAFNKINYSQDKQSYRDQEIDLLSGFLKIDQSRIFMLNQVHGDLILDADMTNNKPFPEADGFITRAENLCLVIRTADCVPVFVFDSKNKILGAVHSGWKGCRLNITGCLIKKMKSGCNSKDNDLYAYVLPSIGPESYIIKMDVGSYFTKDIQTRDNNIYLDLWKNIYRSLRQEGVPEDNIFLSGQCTYRNNTDFFSYRHGDSGRNLNFGYITGI
jgi:polyphenol oxidase